MRTDGDDLLAERVADLVRRLAKLEAQRSSEVTDSVAPQPGAHSAVDRSNSGRSRGLQERIGERSEVLFTGRSGVPAGRHTSRSRG